MQSIKAGSHVYEISVVSYQGAAPADRMAAVFGKDGGTIGRGDGNTLMLPDPNRFVSRLQAKVELVDGRLMITNASSANPLLVNDHEVDAGTGATLADGDELRIGLYLLRVRRLGIAGDDDAADKTQLSMVVPPSLPAARDTAPAHSRIAAPATQLASPSVVASSPIAVDPSLGPLDPLQISIGATNADPFADLIPGGSPVAGREAAPATPSPLPPQAVAPVVPDDVWNDLARFTPGTSAAQPRKPAISGDFDAFAEQSEAKRNADDPLAEFEQSGVALESFDKLDTSIDALFNEVPAKTPLDGIPDPDPVASDPLAGAASIDPLAIFAGDMQPALPEYDRSESDQVPELEAWFRPPEPRFAPGFSAASAGERVAVPPLEVAPSAEPLNAPAARAPDGKEASQPDARPRPDRVPPRDIAPTAVAPVRQNEVHPRANDTTSSQRHDGLLDAFLAGAGIPNAIVKEGLTPDMMKAIGALLATAVQGTIELIAARAMLKREVKADVTLIATTKNNPLKFLPDAESALLQMFGARIPGFMAPVEAMRDAFQDLRAHEVGVIAGMRAALADVLRRFEPEELEKRLKRPGVLESLLPNSREARLWQTFTEMYGDISHEAQDDFQTLFGKAFLAAYENEVARLRGS